VGFPTLFKKSLLEILCENLFSCCLLDFFEGSVHFFVEVFFMNLDPALKKYERLATFNPSDGKAHFALGLLYDARGDSLQAVKSFQFAVDASPKDPYVRFFNGSVLARFTGKFDFAIHQWEKALELDVSFLKKLSNAIPDDVFYPLPEKLQQTAQAFEKGSEQAPGDVYLQACTAFAYGLCFGISQGLARFDSNPNLAFNASALYLHGLLLFLAERWEQSAKVLEKAMEMDKTLFRSYYFLSHCYVKSGKTAQALRCLERLREQDYSHEKGLEMLAELYFKQGRFEQSLQVLNRLLELNPKHGKAHYLFGRSKQEQYKLEEAVSAYRQALQELPDLAEIHFYLGFSLTRLGRWQEAIDSLKKAVQLNPQDSNAWYHLGLAYNQIGNYTEAVSAFQEALSLNPNDAFVHYNLGLAYEKMDNLIAAIDAYKTAIQMNPTETYARYHLALCYERLGQYSLAMQELESVLEQNPQDAYAAYNLGSVYAHLGLADKALEAYSKACELNPNDLYAHFNMGAILARDGLVEEAHEAFKKALELTPKNDAELALYSTLLSQMAVNIEIARLNQKLKDAYFETVKAIIGCLDAKDKYTAGHTNRVSVIATEIGKEMDLSKDEMESLAIAAVLHDIGKVGVPDAILLKQGKLTQEEFQVMKEHPVSGARILENVSFPWTHVVEYVKHHHERYDGTGYPDGLKGDEIPIGARILSLADFFDALATERPYKKAYPISVVIEQAELQSGKAFDPNVIQALKKVAPRLEKLYKPAEALSEVPTWESSLVDSA
jgi:HD-GYP domain-containing protein (c-di-GMP phosphodiesterase class II)/DNA-binding SARP family transcriptional activator